MGACGIFNQKIWFEAAMWGALASSKTCYFLWNFRYNFVCRMNSYLTYLFIYKQRLMSVEVILKFGAIAVEQFISWLVPHVLFTFSPPGGNKSL